MSVDFESPKTVVRGDWLSKIVVVVIIAIIALYL